MKPLTQRQISIIKAVVEEYTETAQPVGSETIDKKYNLGVSPATIRNEMLRLEDMGYLKQPHTSAGRIPSPMALKLYVSELMKEDELPVTEEVEVKERIWDIRHQMGALLRESTRILSEKTGNIAVATTNQGDVYSSGYANILSLPEFFDIDVTRTVLSIVEDHRRMQEIFELATSDEPFHVLLGDDLGSEYLYPCGIAYINFEAGPHTGHLGVIGPSRLNYPYVAPMLKHFGSLLEEISRSWQK